MSAEVSRTAKSARNVGVSLVAQGMVIVLGFVTRTVFIAELGVEMVGVNSVLMSIVALLAFADLGINGALMYSLYKPLADGDSAKVASIVRFAGTLFKWVALVVAVAGLGLLPFVHRFVNLDQNIEHLEIYYLVILSSTVLGYLMIHRIVLMNADQKIHVVQGFSLVFNMLRSIAQIVSLLVFGSFLAFLLILVFFTVANNVAAFFYAGRHYPELRGSVTKLDALEKRAILSSVRDMTVFRFGGLVLHQSPAILMSVIVGTLALGYYSNYLLVVSAAVMLTEVAFQALTPSVGSLVASGSSAARAVFDEMVLLSVVLHGFLAVGIFVFIDDFIALWLGESFQLPVLVVACMVMSFYVVGTAMPMWSFRSATGLFKKTQWVILLTAGLSIGLSFALAYPFGLAGVVIAPAIARIVTGAWYEPWLLIKDHLGGKVWPYFLLQITALILWVVVAVGAALIGSSLSGGAVVVLGAKAAFLLIALPLATWLVFGRTPALRSVDARLRGLASRVVKRSGQTI